MRMFFCSEVMEEELMCSDSIGAAGSNIRLDRVNYGLRLACADGTLVDLLYNLHFSSSVRIDCRK